MITNSRGVIFNGNDDPFVHASIQELLNNYASTLRGDMWNSALYTRKDLNKECDYPETHEISIRDFQDMYDRNPIAQRVVHVYPDECWQIFPKVYEDEDSDNETEFEKALEDVGASLLDPSITDDVSYYTPTEDNGNPIWQYLHKADRLCGIGHYGIILLGLNDGKPLDEPVEGFHDPEDAELPPGPVYVNNEVKPSKLMYMTVFSEVSIQTVEFESNQYSPRYRKPKYYSIDLGQPYSHLDYAVAGRSSRTVRVHWSRVVHVVDEGGQSTILSEPRQRPVWDNLLDLKKVYGGDAEGFWKNCVMRIFLETHPQLGGDVTLDNEALKDTMWNMENGLQRWASLVGMSAKTIAPTVVDPQSHIDVQIDAICVKIPIPKRIFIGSERGELASSQDDSAWNDQVRGRRVKHLVPRVVVPFINHLIRVGVLPAPNEYFVDWEDPENLQPMEKADLAVKRTTALSQYISGNVSSLIDPMDYMTKELDYEEDEAAGILERAAENLPEPGEFGPDGMPLGPDGMPIAPEGSPEGFLGGPEGEETLEEEDALGGLLEPEEEDEDALLNAELIEEVEQLLVVNSGFVSDDQRKAVMAKLTGSIGPAGAGLGAARRQGGGKRKDPITGRWMDTGIAGVDAEQTGVMSGAGTAARSIKGVEKAKTDKERFEEASKRQDDKESRSRGFKDSDDEKAFKEASKRQDTKEADDKSRFEEASKRTDESEKARKEGFKSVSDKEEFEKASGRQDDIEAAFKRADEQAKKEGYKDARDKAIKERRERKEAVTPDPDKPYSERTLRKPSDSDIETAMKEADERARKEGYKSAEDKAIKTRKDRKRTKEPSDAEVKKGLQDADKRAKEQGYKSAEEKAIKDREARKRGFKSDDEERRFKEVEERARASSKKTESTPGDSGESSVGKSVRDEKPREQPNLRETIEEADNPNDLFKGASTAFSNKNQEIEDRVNKIFGAARGKDKRVDQVADSIMGRASGIMQGLGERVMGAVQSTKGGFEEVKKNFADAIEQFELELEEDLAPLFEIAEVVRDAIAGTGRFVKNEEGTLVENHLPGKHDQKTHGRGGKKGVIRKHLKYINDPDGGFTYDPMEGAPTKGYMVSPYPKRSHALPVDEVNADSVLDYLRKNHDLIKEDDVYMGAWHNPADSRVYFDVSVVFDDKNDAFKRGMETDQIAGFDLAKGEVFMINPEATSGGQTTNASASKLVLWNGEEDTLDEFVDRIRSITTNHTPGGKEHDQSKHGKKKEKKWVDPYADLGLEPGEDTPIGGSYEPEEEPDMDEFMKNQYPTGYTWEASGFLMADGSLLDMSHGTGQRADDHRGINPTGEATKRWGWTDDERENRSTVLYATMERARAARIHHSGDFTAIQMVTHPTSAQKSEITDFIDTYNPTYVAIHGGEELENPTGREVLSEITRALRMGKVWNEETIDPFVSNHGEHDQSTHGNWSDRVKGWFGGGSKKKDTGRQSRGIERITVPSGELRVHRNPTLGETQNLIKKHEEVRYFYDEDTFDVYIWDSYSATHAEVGKEIGFKPGGSSQGHFKRPQDAKYLFRFLRDKLSVNHGKHDQSTHGNWAKTYSTKSGDTLHLAERKDDGLYVGGKKAPKHIQDAKIRPDLKPLYVNPNPEATTIAIGMDAKGKKQYKYSDSRTAKKAAAKWGRVSELRKKTNEIKQEVAADTKKPALKENAEVLQVIMDTGMRPGCKSCDTGAKFESHGAVSMKGEHIKVSDKGDVTVELVTGKSGGKAKQFPITDSSVADMLKRRKSEAGDDGYVFDTTARKLRDYSRTKDGGGFKTKDHRTNVATSAAIREIQSVGAKKKFASHEEYKQAVNAVAEKVSSKIGNTPKVALKSYIDPQVFVGWKVPEDE